MADSSVQRLNRPYVYLFGCELKSYEREFKVEAEDEDDAEHQLSLHTVSMMEDAADRFHVVEVEGAGYSGKTVKVTLATLKPSTLPTVSLGGFEVTPPVTFRLKSGPGPVYICGQRFVSVKQSDDSSEEEEENNTSPIKRPSSSIPRKAVTKKIKLEKMVQDDSEEEEDEVDDRDAELLMAAKKQNIFSMTPNLATGKKPKQNNLLEKVPKEGQDVSTKKATSESKAKERVIAAVKEGKPLPKTEQKFENFARNCLHITDESTIKGLWSFLQKLKASKTNE